MEDIALALLNIPQKTKSNQESLKALNDRCRVVIDSVVNSLRGKEAAGIPDDLKASLDRLSR